MEYLLDETLWKLIEMVLLSKGAIHTQVKLLQRLKQILGPIVRRIFEAFALRDAGVLQFGTQRKDLGQREVVHAVKNQLVEAPAHLLQHLLNYFLFRMVEESKLSDRLELVDKAEHVSTWFFPTHSLQFRQLAIGVGVHLPAKNNLLQAQMEWLLDDWIVDEFLHTIIVFKWDLKL
jgi:hypothetical protein